MQGDNQKNEDVIALYLQIIKLKQEVRQGWLKTGITNPESVAEHSFGTAVLAILLQQDGLDTNRVVALALVHDLLECITGDIIWETGIAEDLIIKQKKQQEEQKALVKIEQYLAENHYLLQLLNEYKEQATAEAKYVKLLDKLEMSLQALDYKRRSQDLNEFFISAGKYLGESPLIDVFEEVKRRL